MRLRTRPTPVEKEHSTEDDKISVSMERNNCKEGTGITTIVRGGFNLLAALGKTQFAALLQLVESFIINIFYSIKVE